MSDQPPFDPPSITDEDIRGAYQLLSRPEDAFHVPDGTDPRLEVLKSAQSLDVAACPGSGKTTLLVAKLAILAAKWQHRTRGICVLSHTNVARSEIERKLGGTAVGQRLLSYPHFIGTIHRFVNEFLALPWLRSRGYPVTMIDTDQCLGWRWNVLPHWARTALEKARKDHTTMRVQTTDFGLGLVTWGKGKGPLGPTTRIYRALQTACRQSAERGLFCYDEMFVWAIGLLDRVPDTVSVIRDRFPLLFIDEAQDNSEAQSSILHRIFMNGEASVIRQRFGDDNQAIFDSQRDSEKGGAVTDRFPNESVKRCLPNSHRFGQNIADLSGPLGLEPVSMTGQGPCRFTEVCMAEPRDTIFLFDDGKADKVLTAYGQLLIDCFPKEVLARGVFTAVGQVHRPPEAKKDRQYPQCVRDYWPEYDPELTGSDPQPQTFVQYAYAGVARAEAVGETRPAVEKIAEGLLRLAAMGDGAKSFAFRRHHHRYVTGLLDGSGHASEVRQLYDELLDMLAVGRSCLTQDEWESRWRDVVRKIAGSLCDASLAGQDCNRFLEWSYSSPGVPTLAAGQSPKDNVYRYSDGDKEVSIRVGSIHSVKGQTHTATLVMETFRHAHNLQKLLPWLDGRTSGAQQSKNGAEQRSRLKVHYVAMTRPTHLLCLAMKRSSLSGNSGNLDQVLKNRLISRGWQIGEL